MSSENITAPLATPAPSGAPTAPSGGNEVLVTNPPDGVSASGRVPPVDVVLAEINELALNLRLRNVYSQIQQLIRDNGLSPGRGWLGIIKAIQEASTQPPIWAGLTTKLVSLLEDIFLIGHKRIYVLRSADIKPEQIATPLPDGARSDVLAGKAPMRKEQAGIFYVGQETSRRAVIYKFVTCRIIRKTEAVEKDNLNDSGQLLYQRADIFAKYKMFCRCYDYIIIRDGKAYLLIDAPPNVDSAAISEDEKFYDFALKRQIGKAGERIYEDLFPAVQRIYEDSDEGKVYILGFMSDDKSQVVGSYSATSDRDWRKNKYHVAGSKEATVLPFKLGVKWPEREDKPMLLLPGQPVMVGASPKQDSGEPPANATPPSENVQSFPLRYMIVPRYVGWDSFIFAISRIHQQLSTDKGAVAHPVTPQPSEDNTGGEGMPLSSSAVQAGSLQVIGPAGNS